jgi:hypothetical protein
VKNPGRPLLRRRGQTTIEPTCCHDQKGRSAALQAIRLPIAFLLKEEVISDLLQKIVRIEETAVVHQEARVL